METQKKYVKEMAEMFIEKILEMKNINKEALDMETIIEVTTKAAKHLLELNYIDLGEEGIIDDSTIDNLKNNCLVTEYQVMFSEDIEPFTIINISRYNKEDLSNFDIQLIRHDFDGNTVGVIETKDATIFSISDESGKKIQTDDKGLGLEYTNGDSKGKLEEKISLEEAYKLFKSGKIEEVLENHMIGTHK